MSKNLPVASLSGEKTLQESHRLMYIAFQHLIHKYGINGKLIIPNGDVIGINIEKTVIEAYFDIEHDCLIIKAHKR